MFIFSKAFKGLFIFPLLFLIQVVCPTASYAQPRWVLVDTGFGRLPEGLRLYRSEEQLNGKPFKAYYVEADLKNRGLQFSTDTSRNRRLKPSEFFEKAGRPWLVVNTSFFSFQTNRNLNLIINRNNILSYNIHSVRARGHDSILFSHPLVSALGISRNRTADIAWTFTDSSLNRVYASQLPITAPRDSFAQLTKNRAKKYTTAVTNNNRKKQLRKWRMQTAVGGGPVLIQRGNIQITNNEEMKFSGKAILDAHPRTGIGYTPDGKLIILVVEGRNPGVAEGATLEQLALIFQQLGCVEAMNLDGGGSTSMLINGKETIRPSDKGEQRAIPGVLMIQKAEK